MLIIIIDSVSKNNNLFMFSYRYYLRNFKIFIKNEKKNYKNPIGFIQNRVSSILGISGVLKAF